MRLKILRSPVLLSRCVLLQGELWSHPQSPVPVRPQSGLPTPLRLWERWRLGGLLLHDIIPNATWINYIRSLEGEKWILKAHLFLCVADN